jgi:hypothetical protein
MATIGAAALGAVVPFIPVGPSAGATQQTMAVAEGISVGAPLGIAPGATSGGPAAFVNPIDGTGVGSENPGNVSEYPGASVPFGMVQFSPDTSPDRQVTTGSGYDYADSEISGFSLDPPLGGRLRDLWGHPHPSRHRRGARRSGRCRRALLPRAGAGLGGQLRSESGTRSPGAAGRSRPHRDHPNRPRGIYVSPPPHRCLRRTLSQALARMTSCSRSAIRPTALPPRTSACWGTMLEGSVTSGDFCGIPGNYTLYFSAQFSEKFAASGTWENGAVGHGSRVPARPRWTAEPG